MNRETIHLVLQTLGAERLTNAEGWVNSTCPLAPWRHGGGKDTRPSFGVSVSEGSSVCYCFGCMEEARPLMWLPYIIYLYSGSYPKTVGNLIARSGADEHNVPEVPDPWEGFHKDKGPDRIPGSVVRKYPLLQGADGAEVRKIRAWLIRRGIPIWAQNLFRCRYDEGRKAVVFPLTDRKGRIYLMRERRRDTKNIWTMTPKLAGVPELEFPKLRQAGAWFGMFVVDWRRTVMVVEGEIDAMRIATLGFHNVIASTTSSVTDAQIDALMTDSLILGYDADAAGDHATRRIVDRMGGKSSIRRARWPIVNCNDGGDLEDDDQLIEVLSNLEHLT